MCSAVVERQTRLKVVVLGASWAVGSFQLTRLLGMQGGPGAISRLWLRAEQVSWYVATGASAVLGVLLYMSRMANRRMRSRVSLSTHALPKAPPPPPPFLLSQCLPHNFIWVTTREEGIDRYTEHWGWEQQLYGSIILIWLASMFLSFSDHSRDAEGYCSGTARCSRQPYSNNNDSAGTLRHAMAALFP